MNAIRKQLFKDLADEREKHDGDERTANDFRYTRDELVLAAVTYASPVRFRKLIWRGDGEQVPSTWPWHSDEWKPRPDDRKRELIIAASLIMAELERMAT